MLPCPSSSTLLSPSPHPFRDPRLLPLGPDRLRVEWGPVSLVLAARWAGAPPPDGLEAGGRGALEFLEELAAYRRLLAADVRRIRNPAALPASVRSLVEAARPFAGEFVTPLAAVAGAVADRVADLLAERGAAWAVVSNGGDVALRLAPGEAASVGLVPRVDAAEPVVQVQVTAEDGVGGAATSGFGGRSHTLGIADAVTVFAERAAPADAAATIAANAVDVDSPAVTRLPAEELDPETDLRGLRVTRAVGPLTRGEIDRALDRGAAWVRTRVEEGLVRGAVLSLQGHWRTVGWPGEEGVAPLGECMRER